MIDFSQSPFDKGVWMLSWGELFRLDQVGTNIGPSSSPLIFLE